MKRVPRRKSGRSGLELIEEAVHRLRTASLATLAIYWLGAIPFVLGLLYFWADMSRSPFARQHQAEAALGMAALFFWMKFCQAWFARRMRAQVAAEPMPQWTLRQCVRVFLSQVIVQPSGLFLVPLSLIPALPFPWVYAFYQNATVLAGVDTAGAPKLLRRSWKQASLWPGQNHGVLSILALFGFFVFLNWTIVSLSLPQLIKMLFGIESLFTQSPLAVLNTTFFTAMLGLTWLCVDPVLKVVYALRCFYGESLQSGEDLKAELKPFAAPARPLAAAALLLFLPAFAVSGNVAGTEAAGWQPAIQQTGGLRYAIFAGSATKTAPTPPETGIPSPIVSPPAVPPPALDRAIDEVLHERKYTWRMPREKIAEDEANRGVIARFLEKAGKLIREWLRSALDWLKEFFDKWFRRHRSGAGGGSGYGWMMASQILLYGLIAAVVCAIALLLLRLRRRQPAAAAVVSQPFQPAPDVADENVGADQLPEDGWTKLARELLERGEFRLAMRAFYLASLAHLARRNLITLARFKSNRDYEHELRRRGHSLADLLPLFGENISAFERIWYGMHEVNRERVNQFAANVERIRTGA